MCTMYLVSFLMNHTGSGFRGGGANTPIIISSSRQGCRILIPRQKTFQCIPLVFLLIICKLLGLEGVFAMGAGAIFSHTHLMVCAYILYIYILF